VEGSSLSLRARTAPVNAEAGRAEVEVGRVSVQVGRGAALECAIDPGERASGRLASDRGVGDPFVDMLLLQDRPSVADDERTPDG
jgi:hypothetical protein